jgi:hypothetical protein
MRGVLAGLVARRLWVYAGGLVVVLGVRTALAPSTARSAVAAVVLSVMVVTYAGELWLDADGPPVGRGSVAVGALGVAGGVWLTLGGDLRGLLFLAGGLLFLNRGLSGGASDESPDAGRPTDETGSGETEPDETRPDEPRAEETPQTDGDRS